MRREDLVSLSCYFSSAADKKKEERIIYEFSKDFSASQAES
jgi:hypothetical protein